MKTEEEQNALKKEVETLNAKLAELTEDELNAVAGGDAFAVSVTQTIAKQIQPPITGNDISPFRGDESPKTGVLNLSDKSEYAQRFENPENMWSKTN